MSNIRAKRMTAGLAALAAAVVLAPVSTLAKDQFAEQVSVLVPPDAAPKPRPALPGTIAVEIVSASVPMWSGRLKIGGIYGSASFSQTVSEFAGVCPNQTATSRGEQQTSRQVSFYLNRINGKQEPDKFTINVSVTRPLAPCEGEGNNSIGFNRQVTLVPGEAVRIAGEGGVVVRLKLLRD